MLSRLFIAAVSSYAGKGLTSWVLFVMFKYVFVTFACGILGQVWYLIVSIPDFCHRSYLEMALEIKQYVQFAFLLYILFIPISSINSLNVLLNFRWVVRGSSDWRVCGRWHIGPHTRCC